jgi:basic amino acid/polyamine antiporter, APA family
MKLANNEEAKLKKVLGLTDVLALVIGLTIGPGVLVLMGPGIGLTGKGVVLAFLIAGIANCINVIPMAQLCSAMPTTGAGYRFSSLLLGPRWGFLFELGVLMSKVTIALFALSFGQYAQGLFPGLPVRWTAFAVLTFFFIVNVVGLKSASILQRWLVVIKLSGLAVFVVWGISSVDFASFSYKRELLPGGVNGLWQAVGLVAYSSFGAVTVAELGGEMKRPARDLPIGLIFGTLGVTVVYVMIAFVAAGVLPVAEVANKPLTYVANSIMSHGFYLYFTVAGAIVSIGATLNGVFQWITKGLIVACEDGWLPKRFGAVSARFGTPHFCLIFFYFLGVVVIASGITVVEIARLGFGALLTVNMIPVAACALLPKKYPKEYAEAPFRLKPVLLYPCIAAALLCMAGQVYSLLAGLPIRLLIMEGVLFAVAVVYVMIAGRRREDSHQQFQPRSS